MLTTASVASEKSVCLTISACSFAAFMQPTGDAEINKVESGALEGMEGSSKCSRPKINVELLQQLLDMGFPQIRAERALVKCGGTTVETAIDWLGQHGEDVDIDEPWAPEEAPEAVAPKAPLTEEEVCPALCLYPPPSPPAPSSPNAVPLITPDLHVFHSASQGTARTADRRGPRA